MNHLIRWLNMCWVLGQTTVWQKSQRSLDHTKHLSVYSHNYQVTRFQLNRQYPFLLTRRDHNYMIFEGGGYMWKSNHVAWNHVVRKCRDWRGNQILRFMGQSVARSKQQVFPIGTPNKQTRR